MKSKLSFSTFVFFVIYTTTIYAQPIIPNGDFEKLAPATSINKFESWESISFINPLHARSTDAHSGASAMKVFNKNGEGGDVFTYIKNNSKNHPLKLRGFVKYDAAPGEKVMIAFKVARKETKPTQTITYTDVVGYKTFSGTSKGYEAFEIVMDYSLADDNYLENNQLDLYNITISAFDDVNINNNSKLITDKTFILVDDLTLDGVINTFPIYRNGLPYTFEKWNVMDNNIYEQDWFTESYVNDKYLRHISQTIDAKEGKYALKLSVNKAFPEYSLFGGAFTNTDPTKKIEMSLKYNLGVGDTLRCVVIQKNFLAYDLSFAYTNQIQNSYKTSSIDLSKFNKDSLCFFLIGLEKASPESFNTFFLIDDIKLSGSLAVESIDGLENQIVVFPNPSVNGKFNIKTTLDLPYKLMNAYGNEIDISYQKDSNFITFDINGYPKGIYFLKIGEKITKKLVY